MKAWLWPSYERLDAECCQKKLDVFHITKQQKDGVAAAVRLCYFHKHTEPNFWVKIKHSICLA